MDSNNWRQPEQQPPADGAGGDWRLQLQSDSRQRIVNKIMDTLKRHLPSSGQEGVQELRKIAMRFEEKIYHAATSQSDYLRRISLKMLTMESKSNPPGAMPNAIPSNSASMSRNSQDPASQSMQPQVQNQAQSLPIPMASNQPAVQGRPQILNQNIQMNMGSAGVQSSANLSSALPSANGLAKNNMPNVLQNPNMQSISQNSMGNSMVQGVPSNNFANPQKQQMQGRQNMQQVGSQQAQNQQQYIYQQQQLMKQKLHQGNIHQPLHAQQSNMLPSAQLQSSQQSIMQQQPSMVSSLQQNQPSSIQQSSQSAIQQHQQSVIRQQQQQTQISQQSMLQSQQQQHHMGQQQLGQQTSMQDIQQPQRMMSQQNNLSSMSGQQQTNQNLQQQQMMGQQTNLPTIHQQQQQQQLVGGQSGNPGMQPTNHAHMLQQSKVLVQQQNPNGGPTLLSGSGQQQPQQQQQMMQSQTAQLQQHLSLQQQPNSLQQNMQQRLQSSNALLQQQNVIDPQKMFQSQRTPTEAPSTSLDSTAQTSISESQEEVYQKMKVMKDLYFQEIHDIYQKICLKIQQHDSLSQQAKSDGIERLKYFKQMLERILQCLQMSRSAAQHFQKDKLAGLEKQILGVINSHRPRKPAPPMQQGQISQSHMQAHSQITQAQSHENGVNSQLQSVHGQGDMSGMNGAVSSLTGITSSQPNMMNSLQPASSLESGQGNAPNSIQQNPLNPPQQATPQTGVNLMHPSTNMLQSQHIKQQHEQQLKQQLQHRQQLIHKQQLFQQQQQQQQQQQHLQMQQIKQQPGQVQMPQIQQMNDVNDIKVRQNAALKQQGLLPQHGQRYQQLKPGVSFPNSSPQLLQTGSPQINQHSSPQIDQQNLLPPLNKVGTPLQSANSPFIPSMSPLAPSPMPGDPEKPNIIQQTNIAPASASSLAIGTPGISASPLLAESSPPDGQFTTLNSLSGRSDQPLDRLLKVVKSMSTKALNSAVDDIVSVVSMIDRIAGSAPGNGSRAAVGEDLVAMTKCRLQARNFITQDGSSGMKRMRRYTSAMPLNVASSVGSANNSFKQLIGADTSELESTATSGVKRRRIEQVNPAILDEIKDTNEHLIDTVVDLSDEDVDPTLSAVATEGGEGTIIKCTFNAVSLSPNLKSQYCSAQMSPIQPLRLLVPANYPNCSPILLDKFPVEVSKEYDDLSVKVKSRFSISLRTLSQPMSLREMARTWDDCARCVITEFAQQSGGGTFSSKYGAWENCLSAS